MGPGVAVSHTGGPASDTVLVSPRVRVMRVHTCCALGTGPGAAWASFAVGAAVVLGGVELQRAGQCGQVRTSARRGLAASLGGSRGGRDTEGSQRRHRRCCHVSMLGFHPPGPKLPESLLFLMETSSSSVLNGFIYLYVFPFLCF